MRHSVTLTTCRFQTAGKAHSEPAADDYTSVVLDATGRAHATRHVTDCYSNEYSCTGHHVLP